MPEIGFDIFYCGQLRFVEVIGYHKGFIDGNSGVNAVLTPLLIEKPILGNIAARYSIDPNKSYQESLNFFKQSYPNTDIIEVNENEIRNRLDSNHIYRLKRLFLFLKYFRSNEDYTVVLTTDSIFRKTATVKKILSESIVPPDTAVVIAQKSKQPYLGESGFFIINKLAAEKIEKIDIDKILNLLQAERYESPDEIWTYFFKFCGIVFLPTWPEYYSQRFKPNMVLDDLNNESIAIQKMIEYHKFKKELYDQRK